MKRLSVRLFMPVALFILVLASPLSAYNLQALDATLHGFMDARYGQRLQNDPYQKDESLAETRLQLGFNRLGDFTTMQIRADLYYDDLVDQDEIKLEEGRGWIDLRESNLLFSPHEIMDVKLGRQILTWGNGDLLFINDLFPKDWQSFFIGRDEEYLKAPSDAVFVSLFPEAFHVDLVYVPRFDADRYIRGERISYWNPMLGRIAGQDTVVDAQVPDEAWKDDEFALRLSKNISGFEMAVYGYHGFWKSPAGFDRLASRATFPELSVGGVSLRGNLGPGIGNIEAGYYDSREDRNGDDPLVPNSEIRLLVGYEQEVMRDVTLAGQYYLEALQEYDNYVDTPRDEYRHLLTMRLTWMLLNQNLTLSLFGYVSPSDEDLYLRPVVNYKLTDAWRLTAGANIFSGEEEHTFFGQFENNSNLYAGIRYSF
jgi:hypothetical protein